MKILDSHANRATKVIFVITSVLLLVACQQPSSQMHHEVTSAANGAEVKPGKRLQFPQDHHKHPDYGIEWWYFTANLQDEHGTPIWLQWTLFRYRQQEQQINEWSNNQSYMAHASIHSMEQHVFEERFARGGVGNSDVTIEPFQAYLDHWSFTSERADSMFPGQLSFTVNDDAKVKLNMSSSSGPVLHGESGYSLKYPDSPYASYYYSQPYIEVSGTIEWGGDENSVNGNAWYDHEWSSQLLGDDFSGWDWFSMHLEDNRKLMLFTLKGDMETIPRIWHGTYLDERGLQHKIVDDNISVSILETMTVKEQRFAKRWQVTVPEHDLELGIEVVKEDQYNLGLFSYYEGAINVTGSHSGVGFVEMTGAE